MSFIKGLLNKDQDSSNKPKDDVPDELPPLAKDVLENKDKIGLGDNSVDTKKNDDILKRPNFEQGFTPPKDLSKLSTEPSEHSEFGYSSFKGFSSDDDGFFANLVNITSQQGVNKELLENDLYDGMKSYYTVKSGVKIESTTKQAIEQEVILKLNELKMIEKEWQTQKEFLERNKQELLDKEIEIKKKTEELRLLLKKFNFYKPAPVGKYFRSQNGVIAKDVFELLELLKVIDDKIFKIHRNEKRNDFSVWVKDIIGDNKLANKLNKAKTKEEMIAILESAYVGEIEHIDVSKYFTTISKAVIKNPRELSSALRYMDEKTFMYHVNDEKNDFSFWIRNSFKDSILASKISNIKNKDEMIKFLDEFYKK